MTHPLTSRNRRNFHLRLVWTYFHLPRYENVVSHGLFSRDLGATPIFLILPKRAPSLKTHSVEELRLATLANVCAVTVIAMGRAPSAVLRNEHDLPDDHLRRLAADVALQSNVSGHYATLPTAFSIARFTFRAIVASSLRGSHSRSPRRASGFHGDAS